MVPLRCHEFDFYAQAVVERGGLRADTTYLGQEISMLNNVIGYKDAQLANDRKIFANNDSIFKEFEVSFKKLSKDYQKIKKKHKRTQQISMVLAITSCVLGIIVLVK